MYPGDCVTVALHSAPCTLRRIIVVTGERVSLWLVLFRIRSFD